MYNSKLVFLSIIFTTGLLYISIIDLDNKVLNASTSTDESSSTFSSNLPTLNNTTNYTTYHDERIGISFDYPENWNIDENINRFAGVSSVEVYDDGLDSFKVIKSQSSSDMEIVDRLGGLEFVLELILPNSERIIEDITQNKYTVDKEDTSSALTVIENRPSLPDLGVERIILIHQDMLYTLIYQNTTDSFDSYASQQIFDHIINSFEFVEDSSSDNNGDNDDDE